MQVTVSTVGNTILEQKSITDKITSNPLNAWEVTSTADSTIKMVIEHDVYSALDILADILTAWTSWYLPKSTIGFKEALKQAARSVDGKALDKRINDAVNGSDLQPIDPRTKTTNDAAKAAPPPRRDPLIFDLNGDGLSTIGISTTNPILFDHNADGIKTGTGWVKPDDAFLVLDKNGNGSIDNGRELFGDATLKSNGQLAANGFDALADLDSITNGGNADGIINASDSQYTNLRLWRDLNQDGISQSNELFTLASQNIIGINVASNTHSQILPNGNQLADTGSFIKADGTQGELGSVTGDLTGNLGDINLASDTFHRSFTTALNTASVATLPDMQGSGVVRDLRQAATQSTRLQTLLAQYAATTAATGQLAQIDQQLGAWADTYTKCTSTRLPSAVAYLRKVLMLGECLPEANALSNLATAGAFVPMRSATWACDKPAARRAASISSKMANSSRLSRSYSSRTVGLLRAFAFNSACVNMFNLLHSRLCNTHILCRGLLHFFNKAMQHHNALPYQRTIKHAGNAFCTFKSQFKQTTTKRLSMRQTKVSTIDFHAVNQRQITTQQTIGQIKYFSLQSFIIVGDDVRHVQNSNKYVIKRQAANDEGWRVVA